MKLRHIEAFHAIMVAGSVSGAARLMNLSQPAVTASLQHAEMQLGYPLFSRKGRGLIPTHQAQILYPEIEKLFGQLETVRRLSVGLKSDKDAELKILVVPSLAVQILPMALENFRIRYPAALVSIRTLHSRDIIKAVALREADVGFIHGSLPHPSLDECTLAEGYMVCLSKRPLHVSGASDEIEITDLANQPVIRLYERDPIGSVLSDLCDRFGIQFKTDITVQAYHTALTLAERGFGTAVIDNFTAYSRTDPSLYVYRLAPEVRLHITAVTHPASDKASQLQTSIESFRAALAFVTDRENLNRSGTKASSVLA